MAEEVRREGALDQAKALGPDELNTLQLDILARTHTNQPSTEPPASVDDESIRVARAAFLHENTAALDVPKLNAPAGAQPMPKGKIRPHTGTRRKERVGPVSYTPSEHAELLDAADRHGYGNTISGYLGDISLAFIRGEFTVDLPLHTDRLALQMFRAEVLHQIGRIGNNINQLVHVLHRDDRVEPDIGERLERLDHLLTDIAEALLIPTTRPEGGAST
ncbi:MobC family plasmid mobilization relaxosome protein [Kitasatospora acidiphila]|uniref:MobC family plasmid mobilization relaxosome protein n=1 Tax=Kitasatospora acidiphila TaxID=2567942 RepID=UPI001E4ADD4D|nr:MobC family plasmid mobilization relaxosome protein [Kitasatospora acidiphila]